MVSAAADILDRVGALQRAVETLTRHPDAELQAVGIGMDRWLRSDPDEPPLSLACVLGLPADWRAAWRRTERDRHLLAIACTWFPGMEGRAAAAAVHAAGRRYESGGWIRDRRRGQRPDGLNGAIYSALQCGPLPSIETLRRLFNGIAG